MNCTYRQSDYELLHVIEGPTPGSRFGSSLIIADGKLLVGSPRFLGGAVTEIGAVFVYDDVKAKAASRVITAPVRSSFISESLWLST